MPDPIKAKTRKTAADGTTLTYEYWRGSWTDGDKVRHSVNLGNCEMTTKVQARERLIEAIKADRKPTADQITVADWTQQHIDNLDSAPETVAQYTIARRQAIECWGEPKKLRDVTTDDVEELVRYIRTHPTHKGKAKVSDYTVRNRIVSLGAMFARALVLPSKAKPYLHSNPFDDAEIPNPKGGAPNEYVSIEQTAQLLETAGDKNLRALVALTRLMALRFEEAVSVEVGHIDWSKQAIAVQNREERQGKGDGPKQGWRLVPMSAAAHRLVLERFEELAVGTARLIDVAPLTKGTRQKPQHHMRRLLERAGILNVVKPFHDLRKSQADDWSLLHGCELSAKWCGHGVDVALRHYRKKGEDDLGLVTGLGDPREKLKAAYARLDEKLVGVKR